MPVIVRRNLDFIMANKLTNSSSTSSNKHPKSFSIDAIMNRDSSKSPKSTYSSPSPDVPASQSTSPFKAKSRHHNPISTCPPLPTQSSGSSASGSLLPGFMDNLGMAAMAAAANHLSPFFHPHQLYANPGLLQQMHQHQLHTAPHFNPWINRQSRLFSGGPPNLTDGGMMAGMQGLFFPPYGRKPKRIRTAFSPSQLLRLEHAFEKNHYVVGTERKQLAQNLALSETQVKIWFQNRRTKHKRLKTDGEDGEDEEAGEEEEMDQDDGHNNGHIGDQEVEECRSSSSTSHHLIFPTKPSQQAPS